MLNYKVITENLKIEKSISRFCMGTSKGKLRLYFVSEALALFFVIISNQIFAQNQNSTESNHFRGNISITNNGLSLIPVFSLNRPAAIFELSLGGERLSFDPELRFALDGKPWSFIFWWQYKIIKSEKFRLHIGAHPAFIFEDVLMDDGTGTMVETMEVKRFFAGEISPS
ncbi:hypothetical protein [Cecembia calidifontis]|uniref:hypothetical protein n=1 Tax=Cecembia calidifontis TaxID=1187080 RepID=UPI001F5FE7C0|nr:hypothetical protein [Cecembia calidifontis]